MEKEISKSKSNKSIEFNSGSRKDKVIYVESKLRIGKYGLEQIVKL